jgi:AcrR family transcriptional regulator
MKPVYSPKGLEMQRRILLAATKVVALKGIEKASVTEIARKARITRSLIQYYLPKQDRLMIELIGFIAQEGYRYFSEHDADIRCSFTMPEALEKRIRLNFQFFNAHPHYFQCFMLFFYRASYDDECRALNTRIVSTATGVMKEILKDQNLAERVYFSMNVAIQRCFIIESSQGLEEAMKMFLKDVVEMSKKKGA